MRNSWTSLVLVGAVYGLSPIANAANEPLSYAVDGKCYCDLSSSNSLHKRIVGTPVGGQSVLQVCMRIGEGPELTGTTSGSYNYPVFDDAQCGHGPGPSGFSGLIDDAGTGITQGPKWDLAAAYAQPAPVETKPVTTTAAVVETKPDVSDTAPATSVASSDAPIRIKSRYLKNTTTASTDTNTDDVASSDAVRSKPTIKVPTVKPVEQAVAKPVVVKPKPVQQAVVKKPTPVVTQPVVTQAVVTETTSSIEELPLAKTESMEAVSEEVVTEIVADTETPKVSTETDAVAETIATAPEANKDRSLEALSNALRMPSSTRTSSREFEYLSIMPVNYDFGGNGIQFSASSIRSEKLRFLLRAGLANSYQEAMVGASYIVTPPNADRLTFALTAGIEFGRFTLDAQNVETTVSDTGLTLRANSRFVVNNRFELQAGVGYSGFFDGDPNAFGAALYHMTPQLDLAGEFEVGDNDSFGVGIRYYYK